MSQQSRRVAVVNARFRDVPRHHGTGADHDIVADLHRKNRRIGSNGEVLGRMDISGVTRGEIESAPFATKRGGPVNNGRLAAAYDRPGIKSAAGERRFQLHDRVFVDLPRGVAGNAGDMLMAYRLGEDIGDDAQVVIPTGLIRIESSALGKPMGVIVKQFGEIVLDQAVIQLESIAATTGRAVAVPPGPVE